MTGKKLKKARKKLITLPYDTVKSVELMGYTYTTP
jgi:hypothetical protein